MIGLRSVEESDRVLLRTWRNKPEVAQWMYTTHEISEVEHDDWFDAMMSDGAKLYWVILHSGEPVGIVYLSHIDRANGTAEWGIYVGEDAARGTGAGRGAAFLSLQQAFQELGLERVSCEAIATNERAIRMYELVGFRREGLLRSHVGRSTERLDVVPFGLLRPEWRTLSPGLATQLMSEGILAEESNGS